MSIWHMCPHQDSSISIYLGGMSSAWILLTHCQSLSRLVGNFYVSSCSAVYFGLAGRLARYINSPPKIMKTGVHAQAFNATSNGSYG